MSGLSASAVLHEDAELARGPDTDFKEGELPFSDKQFAQLLKLIDLLKTSDDNETVLRALNLCERLRPQLEQTIRLLRARIEQGSSKKLKAGDQRVVQMNAILALDAEVKRRRGNRLLYSTPPHTSRAAVILPPPTVPPPPTSTAPLVAKTSVNLLDDLLASDDSQPTIQTFGHNNQQGAPPSQCIPQDLFFVPSADPFDAQRKGEDKSEADDVFILAKGPFNSLKETSPESTAIDAPPLSRESLRNEGNDPFAGVRGVDLDRDTSMDAFKSVESSGKQSDEYIGAFATQPSNAVTAWAAEEPDEFAAASDSNEGRGSLEESHPPTNPKKTDDLSFGQAPQMWETVDQAGLDVESWIVSAQPGNTLLRAPTILTCSRSTFRNS